MIVVLWEDAGAFGPWTQLLAAASDMGEARRLAEVAEVPPPEKRHQLGRKHPLHAVAAAQPGILLWRPDEDPDHRDGFEGKPWRFGADEARDFRNADADEYLARHAGAVERRKQRRSRRDR